MRFPWTPRDGKFPRKVEPVTPLSVSVVIACYTERRLPLILRAVESAAIQRPAPQQVVLVVDHNPRLAAGLRDRLPTVTVIENRTHRGASGARNTGAAATATELVAFLDDDAVADPGWLAALVEAATQPGVVGAGGFVRPEWAAGAPPWFPGEFAWVVGATHDGSPTVRTPVRNGWAENMIVRRDAFVAVGGFRTGFGKVGAHSRPEDTDLCIRLQAAGGTWLFEPAARVAHHVPAERSTPGFFLRRCYHEGRGKAELARLLPDRGTALSDERSYVTRVLPKAFARHVRRAVRERRAHHLGRAAAIVAGLAATAAGYAAQRLLDAVRPAAPDAAAAPVPADELAAAS